MSDQEARRMHMIVRCSCGKSIRVPAGSEGKKTRCPACDRKFVIPAEPAPAEEDERRVIPLADDEPQPMASDRPGPARLVSPPDQAAVQDADGSDSNLYELADEDDHSTAAAPGLDAQPAETTCIYCGGSISPISHTCASCGYNVLTRRRPGVRKSDDPSH